MTGDPCVSFRTLHWLCAVCFGDLVSPPIGDSILRNSRKCCLSVQKKDFPSVVGNFLIHGNHRTFHERYGEVEIFSLSIFGFSVYSRSSNFSVSWLPRDCFWSFVFSVWSSVFVFGLLRLNSGIFGFSVSSDFRFPVASVFGCSLFRAALGLLLVQWVVLSIGF